MRSYAPKEVQSRDKQWVSVPSMLRAGQKKTTAGQCPSNVQHSMPYLVKKQFVCYEKDALNIQKAERESLQDEVLTGFYQSRDNFRVNRIRKAEAINNPNPLSVIPRINICNSFQLNNKAMSSTIRTLLAGDFSAVSRPDDIANAVASKLRTHFSLADDQASEVSMTIEQADSTNPYDNY